MGALRDNMDLSLPDFDNPPVVETVLGVQFEQLQKFAAGHFGWYWKQSLGPEWAKTADAPQLLEQFEEFGERKLWGLAFAVAQAGPDRFQVWNQQEDRLIQVQRNRFLYNWRKRDNRYPDYSVIRPEFDLELERFRKFLALAELGEPKYNQWEVTYVNHIPKGELWQTSADWHKVLPGILASKTAFRHARFEDLGGDWRYEIEPQRGRLHVSLNSGKIGGPTGTEVLVLQLTARGPVQDTLDAGLNLGHEAIVKSFADMTSDFAHKAWQRNR